jgi:mono/diheme cytochrome c family protein
MKRIRVRTAAAGFLLPPLVLAVLLAASLLAGCEKLDRDMYDNPAFRPQEDPVRLPPEGSVPTRGALRVPPPGSAEAAALENPERIDGSALLKGKTLYGIHCAPCHGASGKGDGPVAKKFVPTPADISAGAKGGSRPVGELFAVLTHGKNGMPSFRTDLSARERWLVAAYAETLK